MNRELNDLRRKIWTCEVKFSGKSEKSIRLGPDKDLPLGQNVMQCYQAPPCLLSLFKTDRKSSEN